MSTDNQTPPTQITIAVLGLIGVLGAAAIANWDKLFSNPIPTPTPTTSSLPTPTPAPTTSPLPTPTEDSQEYELRLKNAIDLAGSVEAQSLAQLNEAPLYQIYKNEALKLRIGLIETFRNQGVFIIAQRHHIRYDSITIDADKRHARIRAIPTWESAFFHIHTQQCVGRWDAREVPQTIDLELTDAGWMINAIVFDDDKLPPLLPCR